MYKGLIGGPKAGTKVDEMGHAKSKFGIFYHKFGTAQDDDVLVWYVRDGQDVKEEVKALFVGRPRVLCGDDREGSGRRSWLYLDLYRNTNPETANIIIEIPGRQSSQALEQVGPELEEMVAKKRRFLTKDFSGDLRCESRLDAAASWRAGKLTDRHRYSRRRPTSLSLHRRWPYGGTGRGLQCGRVRQDGPWRNPHRIRGRAS